MEVFHSLFQGSSQSAECDVLDDLRREVLTESDQIADTAPCDKDVLLNEIATLKKERDHGSGLISAESTDKLLAKLKQQAVDADAIEKKLYEKVDKCRKETEDVANLAEGLRNLHLRRDKVKTDLISLSNFKPDIAAAVSDAKSVVENVNEKIRSAARAFDMAGLVSQVHRGCAKQKEKQELCALRDANLKQIAEMETACEAVRESVAVRQKRLSELSLQRNNADETNVDLEKQLAQVQGDADRLQKINAEHQSILDDVAQKKLEKEKTTGDARARLTEVGLKKKNSVDLLAAAKQRVEQSCRLVEDQKHLAAMNVEVVEARRTRDDLLTDIGGVAENVKQVTSLSRLVQLYEQKKVEAAQESGKLDAQIEELAAREETKMEKLAQLNANLEDLQKSGKEKVEAAIAGLEPLKTKLLDVKKNAALLADQKVGMPTKEKTLEQQSRLLKGQLLQLRAALEGKKDLERRQREENEALAREEESRRHRMQKQAEEKRRLKAEHKAKKRAEKERLLRAEQERLQLLKAEREQQDRMAREKQEEEDRERERLARQAAPKLLAPLPAKTLREMNARRPTSRAMLDDSLDESDGGEDEGDQSMFADERLFNPQEDRTQFGQGNTVVRGGEETRETARPDSLPAQRYVTPLDDSLMDTDDDEDQSMDPFNLTAMEERLQSQQTARSSQPAKENSESNGSKNVRAQLSQRQQTPKKLKVPARFAALDDSLAHSDGDSDDPQSEFDPFNLPAFLSGTPAAAPANEGGRAGSQETILAGNQPRVTRRRSSQGRKTTQYVAMDDSLMQSSDDDDDEYDPFNVVSAKTPASAKKQSGRPKTNSQPKAGHLDESTISFDPSKFTTSTPIPRKKGGVFNAESVPAPSRKGSRGGRGGRGKRGRGAK